MSYAKFRSKMLTLSKTTGIPVRTKHEDGKYTAWFSSGIQVTGNSDSKSITVKWGDGHQCMQEIA